jgi:hypothetical protein
MAIDMDPDYEFALTNAEKILSVHGSLWDAQKDLAKSLISLASGSLVLTISFLEKIPGKSGHSWLLVSSWVFMGFSSAAGVACLWYTVKLASIKVRFFNESPKYTEMKKNMTSLDEFKAGFKKLLEDKELHNTKYYAFCTIRLTIPNPY